jgi:diguanylate cyclase (GGDEF)-like protein
MGASDSTDILLIGDGADEAPRFLSPARDEFVVSKCIDTSRAAAIMTSESIRIAIVLCHQMDDLGTSVLRHLRNTFLQEPVQILGCVAKSDDARTILEYGADDYLIYPCESQEFYGRLFAAVTRLRSLIRVYGERDFFRKAAKQEEELSSRILDQHLILKEAFQSIESMNQELEETNKQLEQDARYDVLSGLMNRNSLFNAMSSEIERATRSLAPLSGIMMDVDNFKDINDRFGHLHGDRVIAEIGRRLKVLLRKYDFAGRYGGEEFFVILPNSSLQQAYLIAERFRKQMAENPQDFSGDLVTITASFGIAQYRTGETREGWVSRCDSYLYHAKNTGRNRVVGE